MDHQHYFRQRKKILIVLLSFSLVSNNQAQVSFGSAEIHSLFDQLPKSIKGEISQYISKNKDATLDSEIEFNHGILRISAENQVIKHLGIRVNEFIAFNKFDSVVNDFIERAFLRLSFEKSIPDLVNAAETMQLKIFYQYKDLIFSPLSSFEEVLEFIDDSAKFSLTRRDNLFIADWNRNDTVLTCVFPNSMQFISGKNKIELDRDLFMAINGLNRINHDAVEPDDPSVLHDTSGILIHRGTQFMGILLSDIYYRKSGTDSILVFEEDLIGYSVPNLFLNRKLTGHRKLQLDHKFYGGKTKTYRVDLSGFLDYFDDDFQCFIGLEKDLPNSIEGTVVFNHKYFNYINMLHFKTNTGELFNDEGIISADFYSNIPMHNVTDLFKKNLPDHIKDKIDINN